MPDWFYRTISQPVLFAVPADVSRRFVLGFMGLVGGLPLGIGRGFIDFLGHMSPPERLRTPLGEWTLQGPLGASCWFDGEGQAVAAWTRFGFGLIELGPTWCDSAATSFWWSRDDRLRALVNRSPAGRFPSRTIVRRAARATGGNVRLLARVAPHGSLSAKAAASGVARTIHELEGSFAGFTLDLDETAVAWSNDDCRCFWRRLLEMVPTLAPGRLALVVTPTLAGAANAEALLSGAADAGVTHWLLEYRQSPVAGRQNIGGRSGTAWLVEQLRAHRKRLGGNHVLIASGGVTRVRDATELREAGADLMLLDGGLVFSGPGLVKRINEMLAATAPDFARSAVPNPAGSWFRESWFWGAMLGLAMFIGSLLALAIASTRVVLPYDEVFCGLTRDQLASLNPRLLLFMAHDRISLAGTMIAIGVLYGGLAGCGMRHGAHWARVAVLWSAGFGFASFFLFLAFGYFDPFHGFVTAILFQLYVQCLVGRTAANRPESLEPDEDDAWRRGQWGQLLLVVHGAGLLLAGLTITLVGVMDVFVGTDLRFLGTTADALRRASGRLVPLIAHDRATMGAMLIAAGIPFLLSALWGMGRGKRWLWWTMALAGFPAYACAIGVHFVIGYTDVGHLMPAYAGLGLFVLGMSACRRWMWRQ